jgi:hypothetical protein
VLDQSILRILFFIYIFLYISTEIFRKDDAVIIIDDDDHVKDSGDSDAVQSESEIKIDILQYGKDTPSTILNTVTTNTSIVTSKSSISCTTNPTRKLENVISKLTFKNSIKTDILTLDESSIKETPKDPSELDVCITETKDVLKPAKPVTTSTELMKLQTKLQETDFSEKISELPIAGETLECTKSSKSKDDETIVDQEPIIEAVTNERHEQKTKGNSLENSINKSHAFVSKNELVLSQDALNRNNHKDTLVPTKSKRIVVDLDSSSDLEPVKPKPSDKDSKAEIQVKENIKLRSDDSSEVPIISPTLKKLQPHDPTSESNQISSLSVRTSILPGISMPTRIRE